MSCRNSNYPNNLFDSAKIQYHIVSLADIAIQKVKEYESVNQNLCDIVVNSLYTAKFKLAVDPMCHQDVLDTLDALQLLIEPMVQLRRIFVLSRDADKLLKIMAVCQLLNSLIVLTEVLHTMSHHDDHKDIDNSSQELFKFQMDVILKELGIDVE